MTIEARPGVSGIKPWHPETLWAFDEPLRVPFIAPGMLAAGWKRTAKFWNLTVELKAGYQEELREWFLRNPAAGFAGIYFGPDTVTIAAFEKVSEVD